MTNILEDAHDDAVTEIHVEGQRIQLHANMHVFPLILAPSSSYSSSSYSPTTTTSTSSSTTTISPATPFSTPISSYSTPTTTTNISSSSLSSSLPSFISWLKRNVSLVEQKLVDHGVLIFRGFPLNDAKDMLACINAFFDAYGWEQGSYVGGGGPRNEVLGPIHTSTETPADFFINFHHELAYLPTSPSKLFFFCETPPHQDGETPLLLSHTLYHAIKAENPSFIENIINKGVRYIRILEDMHTCERKYQRGWQEIYNTSDRGEAEEKARKTGVETVEWLDGNRMKVTSVRMEGVRIDPRNNMHVFFNSVVLLHPATQRWQGKPPVTDAPVTITKHDPKNFKFHVTYGDFSEVADEDVLGALAIMQKEKVVLKWAKGDLVIVDNNLALHARNPFTPPRRILTAIVK